MEMRVEPRLMGSTGRKASSRGVQHGKYRSRSFSVSGRWRVVEA